MRLRLTYLFTLLFLFLAVAGNSQRPKSRQVRPKSRAVLEREKRENLKRIKEANRILEQTKAQKEASIGQLNAIKEKITVQKGVIRNVSSELHYIESDVHKTENQVTSLQTD